MKGREGKDGGLLAFHWGEGHMLPVRPEAANPSFPVGAGEETCAGGGGVVWSGVNVLGSLFIHCLCNSEEVQAERLKE